MEDSETIQTLTNTLLALKRNPFVSLRMWFEEGQLRYFLSNLPPKNARNSSDKTRPAKEKESDPPNTSPVKTRGKGRKRQCLSSTPGNRSSEPEQLRRGRESVDLQVSVLELDREIDEPDDGRHNATIPCSNTFDILANLNDSTDESDADPAAVDVAADSTKLCPRCRHNLRSISSDPKFPAISSGIKGYSCGSGHIQFKPDNTIFACDSCRMLMCSVCLQNNSFIDSLTCESNDKKLRELIQS